MQFLTCFSKENLENFHFYSFLTINLNYQNRSKTHNIQKYFKLIYNQ